MTSLNNLVVGSVLGADTEAVKKVLRNPIEDLLRARTWVLQMTATEEGTPDPETGTATSNTYDVALFVRSKEMGAFTNEISIEYKNGVFIVKYQNLTETYTASDVPSLREQVNKHSKLIELKPRAYDIHDKKADPALKYRDAALATFGPVKLRGGQGLTTTIPIMPPGWLQPVRRIINRESDTGKLIMNPTTYYWKSTGLTTGLWTIVPQPENLN